MPWVRLFLFDQQWEGGKIKLAMAVYCFKTKIMSEKFENVSIITKANVYFGGQVTSRTVVFADGSRKTLGFMQSGDYEFGTEAPECMEMLGGSMEVKLAGEDSWTNYTEGESFNVPGNSQFALKVAEGGADYCCTYLN